MARPIEFDRVYALDAAMQLFWRQGYTATSMQQLLENMGIGRSSFYAAFKDKRSLFVETLLLFADRTAAIVHAVRNEGYPTDTIRRFFTATILDVPARRVQRGCLMVNTVLELADVDPGLSALATEKLDDIERLFEQCFSDAMDKGEYRGDLSAQQLARFVMTLNQGVRVAARKKSSKAELQEVIETGLSLLGLAGLR